MFWKLIAAWVLALAAAPAQFRAEVPKAWDEQALQAMTVPLTGVKSRVKYAPAGWYYRIPERRILRGYPVYAPGKEPQNYMNFLSAQAPEAAFDASKLTTEFEWTQAGEAVFSAPAEMGLLSVEEMHDTSVWEKFGFTADYEGALPGWRYVVRKKGLVEVAATQCATCHARVVDGLTIAGAPGTQLNGALSAFLTRRGLNAARDWDKAGRQELERQFALFSAPWISPDPAGRISKLTPAQLLLAYDALTPGVEPRSGTSLLFPPKVPDLIGIKDRKYMGLTGVHRHSNIGDLMRRSALETGFDSYSEYDGFRPAGALPEPAGLERLGDAQLYALAVYIYGLKPPANPNRFAGEAKRGQKIFEREGCAACHPAPLYTTNKPVPIAEIGTDPRLSTESRIATGAFAVPSLKGLWYRGPFEHNGSAAMLEDVFDPMRLRPDYIPTGFKGFGVEARAVPGHLSGLKLPFEERRALMAFLRTL